MAGKGGRTNKDRRVIQVEYEDASGKDVKKTSMDGRVPPVPMGAKKVKVVKVDVPEEVDAEINRKAASASTKASNHRKNKNKTWW